MKILTVRTFAKVNNTKLNSVSNNKEKQQQKKLLHPHSKLFIKDNLISSSCFQMPA